MVVDRIRLTRTSVVAIAGTYLLLGMVVGAYGPLLEHLTRRFLVSLPVAGTTISVYFTGGLAGVLAAMLATAKVTGRALVTSAIAVAALGCAVVALAPSWPALLLGVFVIGLGFGALVLGLNQLVAYSEGGRRAALLSGLNAMYSAGAVIGPILVATLAADHFRELYLGAAALALVLVAGASRISGRLPVDAAQPGRPDALVGVFVVAFVLYVAVESGTGGFMAAHLEANGIRSATAAASTSAFFLAIMAGRLAMTLMPSSVRDGRIVLASSALGAGSLALAWAGGIAPFAYILAGLAISPIFPTGIVWLARLRPGNARATAWLYPATSVGGIAGPGVIAFVIARAGVGWTPIVLALVAAGMFAFFLAASRR